jgi:hypothetical protein
MLNLNRYNLLLKKINIKTCIAIAFMQNVVKLGSLIKPCILLGVILFLFMMGKSS